MEKQGVTAGLTAAEEISVDSSSSIKMAGIY